MKRKSDKMINVKDIWVLQGYTGSMVRHLDNKFITHKEATDMIDELERQIKISHEAISGLRKKILGY